MAKEKIPGPELFSKEIIGHDTQGRPVYRYEGTPIEVSKDVTLDLGTGDIGIGGRTVRGRGTRQQQLSARQRELLERARQKEQARLEAERLEKERQKRLETERKTAEQKRIESERRTLTEKSFQTRQELRQFAAERGLEIETAQGLQKTLLRLRRERRGEVEPPKRKPPKVMKVTGIVEEEGALYKELTLKRDVEGEPVTEQVVGRELIYRPDVTPHPTRMDLVPQVDVKVDIPKQEQQQMFTIPAGFSSGLPKIPKKETGIEEAPGIPEGALGYKFEVKPPTTTEKLREKSFIEQASGTPTLLGTAGGIGAGAVTSVIGTKEFVKGIATDPVETVGKTAEAVTVKLPQNLKTVGTIIETEPAFATGFVAGEVIQFKAIRLAQKGILKISDVYRTAGLQEIKTPVAKEYFRGQRYPAIRRGQTVGELLKEYKPKLKGEKLPAGYTAAQKPISELIVRKGTSELPGLYQAPDVSPAFLRVGGYGKKPITINVLGESLRPTVFRITPKQFKLVPGLKPTQTITQPGRLGTIRTFLGKKAPKGYSYIPFVKTEKEAILVAGTTLTPPIKRFYFKFEGRRVPIYEYGVTGKGVSGAITTDDIAKVISSTRVGRKGMVTPPELITLGYARERERKKYSSISLPPSSSTIKSSGSISTSLKSYPSKISSRASISSSLAPKSSVSKAVSRASVSGYGKSIASRYRGYGKLIPMLPPPTTPGKRYKGLAPTRRPKGLWGVAIKRYGKYQTIGANLKLPKAISLGKGKVTGTLAATYKLFPTQKGMYTGGVRTPLGFYRGKQPLMFIEKPKHRISTKGEKIEIQGFRRRKTKKKRK